MRGRVQLLVADLLDGWERLPQVGTWGTQLQTGQK